MDVREIRTALNQLCRIFEVLLIARRLLSVGQIDVTLSTSVQT
jgi:hypothetical protein